MPKRTYADKTLRLVTLADSEGRIADAKFTDCKINGPAVILAPEKTEILDSIITEDPDSVFWLIVPGRRRVVGVVLLERCTFHRCHFTNIGFAAGGTEIEEMKKVMVGPDATG